MLDAPREAQTDWPAADEQVEDDQGDDGRSSWKGKGVEALIAAHCVLASGGRLNVSLPLVDDDGADVIVHLRGWPATLAVQVKARFSSARVVAQGRYFRAGVRRATFQPRSDLALLFVHYDDVEHLIRDVWLVPSDDFAYRTRNTSPAQRRLVFAASLASTSNQWLPYRCGRNELPVRLVAMLERLNGVERA